MSIFTATFWKAATERAVKTAAQAAVLVIGAEQVSVLSVSWAEVAGLAAGGALLSVLTSIISAPFGAEGPSLGPESTDYEPQHRAG